MLPGILGARHISVVLKRKLRRSGLQRIGGGGIHPARRILDRVNEEPRKSGFCNSRIEKQPKTEPLCCSALAHSQQRRDAAVLSSRRGSEHQLAPSNGSRHCSDMLSTCDNDNLNDKGIFAWSSGSGGVYALKISARMLIISAVVSSAT